MARNPSEGIEPAVVSGGATQVENIWSARKKLTWAVLATQVKNIWSARKKLAWAVLAVLVIIFVVMIYFESKEDWPRFHLDSVSASVHKNATAVWDIGFSIDRPVGDLEVWGRFMDRDFVAESSGIAGNTTVSLSTTVPASGLGLGLGLGLEQVVFKCNNYKDVHRYVLKAVCKDVAVGNYSEIPGGPRLCPVVYNDLIIIK